MKKTFLLSAALCLICTTAAFADSCDPKSYTWLETGQDGLGEMTTTDSDIWTYDSRYGAKGTAFDTKKSNATAWLITPVLDLAGTELINLSFEHTHKFAGTPSDELTLWVSDDYTGNVNTSTWVQLTIPNYATNTNWTFVSNSIIVPSTLVGSNTVIGFKYQSTATNYATWEIKNLKLSATYPADCGGTSEGKIRVVAQNLKNYFYNYSEDISSADYSDEAGFQEKTQKIVRAMLTLNADIYAFCEVEAQDVVLQNLATQMNTTAGVTGRYVAVTDGLDNYYYDTYRSTKAGFIYRADKVAPVGANTAATTDTYYAKRMRIQAFKDMLTNERLVISMNHFKAKDSSDDQGESTRQRNATNLVSTLKTISTDPDILLIGDLNSLIGEAPLNTIEDANFEEQLLRFNESTYSHCYDGGELIDHVYANPSMSEQILNAYVYHNCTYKCTSSVSYSDSYSDHDPYVIDIQLASDPCENLGGSYLATNGSDLGEMTAVTVSGSAAWKYDSRYGATCKDQTGGEQWLVTPVFNFSQATAVSLSFEHAINYANNMSAEQTLWVTNDFSTVEDSKWTQLTIPTYPTGSNWTFVTASVQVPLDVVGKATAFGFKYTSTASNYATWEIKNLTVEATCEGIPSADIQDITDKASPTKAVIRLHENGTLYILLPDGRQYNLQGARIN